MHWRIIESDPLSGPENMAVDQALLESVLAGGLPILRFYRWAPACISLGRNQVVTDPDLVEAEAERRGISIVRRATGGAAVLHDQELTYSVAIPVGLLGSPRETYWSINRALVGGLRELGLDAEVASGNGTAEGPPNWENPCFQAPAPGEVVVDGLKLVGSAQRREGRTLLQHGSILLAGDQGVVAECLATTGPGVERAGFTTVSELLGLVPTYSDLTGALTSGFRTALGIDLEPDRVTGQEEARLGPLIDHFRSRAWTWRR